MQYDSDKTSMQGKTNFKTRILLIENGPNFWFVGELGATINYNYLFLSI